MNDILTEDVDSDAKSDYMQNPGVTGKGGQREDVIHPPRSP